MRAVKSVSIDSERRVIITFLDGSTETLYPNCIWCDSEALRQLIKDLLEEKADAITQTIENATIATFADGADEALIKKLLVSVDPIQEGTGDPSPENIRPISGRTGLSVARTGKNLLDKSTYKFLNDSNIVWGATATTYFADGSFALPAGTYTLSVPETVDGIYVTDDSSAIITRYNTASVTFSLTKFKPVKIIVYKTETTSEGLLNLNYQLELGSTATDYEPYKGNTYSVNWEAEAGTVYGGTLDVVSGKLAVDRAIETITKDSNWYSFSTGTGNSSAVVQLANTPLYVTGTSNKNGSICSSGLELQNYWTSARQNESGITDNGYAFNSTGVIRFHRLDVSTITTLAEFKTAFPDTQVCYKLATPTEIQLSPQEITTLLGANNIWVDSGNILELEYVADTKLYIGESQSGTLGSGIQTITKPEIQTISDKTVEDIIEAEDKETQEETEDERGE